MDVMLPAGVQLRTPAGLLFCFLTALFLTTPQHLIDL